MNYEQDRSRMATEAVVEDALYQGCDETPHARGGTILARRFDAGVMEARLKRGRDIMARAAIPWDKAAALRTAVTKVLQSAANGLGNDRFVGLHEDVVVKVIELIEAVEA